jgi:hypothetical protein
MVVWVLSRYPKYKQGDPRLPVAAAEPLARGSASSGLMDGSREAGGESSECLNGNHTRDLRDEYSGCDTRLLTQGYVDSHYASLSTRLGPHGRGGRKKPGMHPRGKDKPVECPSGKGGTKWENDEP